MSTRYVCDWCNDQFDDHDQVASVDLTVGTHAEKLHICAKCVPDWLRDHFPEERKLVTDGGKVKACRNCNSSRIRKRDLTSAHSPFGPSDPSYRCHECGDAFETPVYREPKCGLAKYEKLLRDSDGEIVTDGGEEIKSRWTLECMDCDWADSATADVHPAEGPPKAVEKAVRLHKNTTDESHTVCVKGTHVADVPVDPSLLTDGGVDTSTLVFQQPDDGGEWHVFDEDDSTSLCGAHDLDPDAKTLEVWGPPTDEYESDRDCEACCREAGILVADPDVATDGGEIVDPAGDSGVDPRDTTEVDPATAHPDELLDEPVEIAYESGGSQRGIIKKIVCRSDEPRWIHVHRPDGSGPVFPAKVGRETIRFLGGESA